MIRASRMREELAESRAKLTKAQRIARLGSWEWNIAARWVKLSEECFPIAGLPQQDDGLADWFVWSRVVEDERARIEMLFREALAGTGQMKFECRIARPNGQIRVVHIEAEVDRDEGGRAVAVHGVDAGHHRAQACRRSNSAACQLRQPDRVAEPAVLSRSVRLRPRACADQRNRGRRAVHRPGSIQADQRHARAIRSAINCCAKSPRGCISACAKTTPWRARPSAPARRRACGRRRSARPPAAWLRARSRRRHRTTPTASRAWVATSSRFC